MTARNLPFFFASVRALAGKRLLLGSLLLAASAVQSAPVPARDAAARPQQMAFAFGRSLVAPPKESTGGPSLVVVTDAPLGRDVPPRPHPYRSACNFTTGCH